MQELLTQICQHLGRVEGKQDLMLESQARIEKRVEDLEGKWKWLTGIVFTFTTAGYLLKKLLLYPFTKNTHA